MVVSLRPVLNHEKTIGFGINVICDEPCMDDSSMLRYVYFRDDKRFYYDTETQKISSKTV